MTEPRANPLAPRQISPRDGWLRALRCGLAAAVAAAIGCGGTGLGAETRTDISGRMATARSPIEACYEAALKANRKLQGTMVLSLVAAPQTGQFQDIAITRDDLNDPGMRKCVVDEVGKLKLEKPQASRVSVSYPLHFAPSN
jgi:hypothetical protein